ncbi:hypothetical protein [Kitasatospora acidiphila]|uniref:hypothetical protein n=1 Tax=Kitasatospora acidiphila TaxID=2567942 RepID=UPI003C78AA0F
MPSTTPRRSARVIRLLAGFALAGAVLIGGGSLAAASAHAPSGHATAMVQGPGDRSPQPTDEWNSGTTG